MHVSQFFFKTWCNPDKQFRKQTGMENLRLMHITGRELWGSLAQTDSRVTSVISRLSERGPALVLTRRRVAEVTGRHTPRWALINRLPHSDCHCRVIYKKPRRGGWHCTCGVLNRAVYRYIFDTNIFYFFRYLTGIVWRYPPLVLNQKSWQMQENYVIFENYISGWAVKIVTWRQNWSCLF